MDAGIDCGPRQRRYDGGVALLGGSHAVSQEKFLCECIECGYTMESEVHCLELACPLCGGTMRRAERPGPGQPKPRSENPSVVYQGVPSGNFVSPYVEVIGHPDNIVPVGEEIKLRAHYEAHCPGQPWYAPEWTVSVKAKGDGIAVKNDTTHPTEGPVTGSPYLNTPSWPIMPNKAITLEVALWGHPEWHQELPLGDP